MESGVKQLLSCGFELVGEWSTSESLVHRAPSIKRKPGIYAFAIQENVCYIGMAKTLHRRLRAYGNRCFRPSPNSAALRICHEKTIETVSAGDTVQVYAAVKDGIGANLYEIERDLIRQFAPPWNKT